MGMSQNDGKMEGWLYLIRFNRFGLQCSRKRYFVLQYNCLKSFKSIPVSDGEEPVRSATIDSSIRVMDNGRESMHKKTFFIFTISNTSKHNSQLKFAASSSEEAARWIHSFRDAAVKLECSVPANNSVSSPKKKWQPFGLGIIKRSHRKNSVDQFPNMHLDAMTSDVIGPSPWKIFGCQNGLRLFKEAKDKDSNGKHWDDNSAIMAVGVVDATSEDIFQTLMSLGPSRSEWDFCFYRGSVVEHIDGHTDIIHKQLYSDWLPWGMKRRDLLLRRYWRRENDGTYVILYHSVAHTKRPQQKGYIRACLKSGGYVITPVVQGKKSLVKHMIAIDWKYWKFYFRPSSARAITISMLERVAALRELFRAKSGNDAYELSSDEFSRELTLTPQIEQEDLKMEVISQEDTAKVDGSYAVEDEMEKLPSKPASLMGLNDVTDEFFDVPEATDYEFSDNWHSQSPGWTTPDLHQIKPSSKSVFAKKLHELVAQKKVYSEKQDVSREESTSCRYGATLQKDPSCAMPCSWTAADPFSFLIRGENYLRDRQKIKTESTLMQMVGADWLRSDIREDDLASRPGSIVQKYAELGGPEFFFIVNIQFPGSVKYNLALYYMMKTPLKDTPLLESFVNGDDAYRNSRFKLIPYVSQGSWIVKQSVGKKTCLIGQALEVNYFRGKNYLEIDIDVGSSTVARGVVNLVLGYLNNLVLELAFLIQGNTQEELPEALLGTCRFNHLDVSKSVLVRP